MKKFLFVSFAICSFLFRTMTSFAQNDVVSVDSTLPMQPKKKPNLNRNFIKTNITGIVLKNYSLQYERTVSRKISVALAFRMMPTSSLPFTSSIISLTNTTDEDSKKTIKDFRLSNTAITPEIRFYLSKKGYGRGFYIAPFFRYATFKTSDIDINYTDTTGTGQTLKMSGKLTSSTGGFLLGIQKIYGKVVLDIWLLGPHFGNGKGTFSGISSKTLSSAEQDDIRGQLNDIDIPLTDKTVTVDANNATLKLDGPWGGIRSGISLGIKF